MKNRIKQILKTNSLPKIDKDIKDKSINVLRQNIYDTDILMKEPILNKIRNQIGYVSKKTFLLQLLLLCLGLIIVYNTPLEDTRLMISWITPALAVIVIIETNRSFKYNMYELEMSCKLNLKTILLIRMLITSIISLFIITTFAIISCGRLQHSFYLLAIYFLEPFLLTNIICLKLFDISKNKLNDLIILTVAIFVNIIITILAIRVPAIYESTNTVIWIALFTITLLGLIKSIYQIFNKEEEFIWNLQ